MSSSALGSASSHHRVRLPHYRHTKERLGQTLGAAEIGRQLGDAGGPLLVGAVAAAATLTPALLVLAALLTCTAAIVATRHPQQSAV